MKYHPLDQLKSHDHTYMSILAVFVGILSGFGAVILRELIRWVQKVFYGSGEDFINIVHSVPSWKLILVPGVGGLIVGILVYFLAREAKGHGVPEVIRSVTLEGGNIPARVSVVKTIVSAITMGSGGSVGPEGPIVQIGASIGSTLGKWLGVSPKRTQTLVLAGAAGGLAAVFNAPIAGALFAVEIILGDISITTFSPIIIASVTATVVSRHHFGNYPAFQVPAYHLVSWVEYFFYGILGLLAGGISILFINVLYRCEDFFESIKIPEYIQPMIGGLLVGVIFLVYPQTFGDGYGTITNALSGNEVWKVLLALAFVKILTTALSLGSGGSGGVFAPALFIGAAMGGFFGNILNYFYPQLTAAPGAYALVGMGAVVAGSMFCPITAIIMIFEITNEYTIILPLMISCVLSTLFVHKFKKGSIYTLKLLRRGIHIENGKEIQILKSMQVMDVMRPVPRTITSSTSVETIATLFKQTGQNLFPVVENNKIRGIVTFQYARDYLFDNEVKDVLIAEDIECPYRIPVYVSENLFSALEKLNILDQEEWPVVSPIDPLRILGVVRKIDIFNRYNNEVFFVVNEE